VEHAVEREADTGSSLVGSKWMSEAFWLIASSSTLWTKRTTGASSTSTLPSSPSSTTSPLSSSSRVGVEQLGEGLVLASRASDEAVSLSSSTTTAW